MKGIFNSSAVLSLAFAVSSAEAFEKLALVDQFDNAYQLDIETVTGTVQMVDYVARETGATTILWRPRSGGLPRYRSEEESSWRQVGVLDKRRAVPDNRDIFTWLRMSSGKPDLMAVAAGACLGKGVGWGVHECLEEAHWTTTCISQWTMDHPQYWCRQKGKSPFHGIASKSYPEVVAHRLRLIGEYLRYGGDTLYFDLFRDGQYHAPEYDYVEPVLALWKERYGDVPLPDDFTDERWIRCVAKFQNDFYRAIRKFLDAQPRKVRFIIGINYLGLEPDREWRLHALDWRALAKEGVFDGVSLMSCWPDTNDPWESTRRIYEQFRKDVPASCQAFYPIMQYVVSERASYGDYAKWGKVSRPEAVRRLLELSKSCGGAGVTLEVVDYGNYQEDVCKVLRDFR